MSNAIVPQSNPNSQPTIFKPFESIMRTDENGNECWYARELMPVLEYTEWRNFTPVINKAMIACQNSGLNPADHFVGAHDMIETGKGAMREVDDFKLSRFACYFIAQNGDPRKTVIANAQTYFATQTRRQELATVDMSPLGQLKMIVSILETAKRELQEVREIQGDMAIDIEDVKARQEDKEYFRVEVYCAVQGIKSTPAIRNMWGRDAAALSRARGVQIKKVPVTGRLWPTEDAFHQSILAEVCVAKPKNIPGQPPLPSF